MKKLSGLDDTKVLKGRNNFGRLRRLTEELVPSIEKRRELKERIDKHELFYQSDFAYHLQKDGDHACCCLTCGFFDESKYFTLMGYICTTPSNAAATVLLAHRNSERNCLSHPPPTQAKLCMLL
jgi:hypothetical protein